jgi:tetratricopeptide (TPR) repeat protein/tRNA A-37 threonylcarbamoyl transferase component Bud32
MGTADHWQRIEEIFHEASALAGDERTAFLDAASGDDAELRSEVERLLASSESVGNRFERLIGGAAVALAPDAEEKQSTAGEVGRFQIDSVLGEGGMGTVYLGHRADGEFRQQVAIKLVRSGLHSAEAYRRFRRERQVLADLEHPNVARLLDGGTTPDGRPYLVMEHVAGEPIDAFCDRRRLPIADRVRLVRQVCAAVHYAHERSVVHRDLKPSNILVTAAGEPKLLDFGIAKLLHDDDDAAPALTHVSQRALTPESASPEQIRGGSITAATDVYALGLLLYRLVTGLPARTLAELGDGWQRAVCEQQPVPPSVAIRGMQTARDPRLSEITSARNTDPQQLARQLAGDLDRIVLKALRQEPEERYATAEQLSKDLARWLEGRPAEARRSGWLYAAGKLLRRHRATSAALATALVAAAILGLIEWPRRVTPVVAATATDPAPAVARRSAAVLGFRDLGGGQAESAWIGSALSEMLAGELAAGETLRVVPGGEVARVLAETGFRDIGALPPATITRLARNLGADVVLLGSYLRAGDGGQARLRVDCSLIEGSSGTLVRLSETGTESALLDLVARLGARLRESFGVLPLTLAQQGALSASRPQNPQAARLYASGIAALRGFDSRRARDLLGEAVAADPDFALAHAALADTWRDLGDDGRARAASRRAFELADKLPRADRIAVEARYHESIGAWGPAIETYRTLLTLFPDDPEPALALAAVETSAGRAGEALATLDELVRRIPKSGRDPRIDLAKAEAAGSVSDFRRQRDAARRAAAAGRERGLSLLVARARISEWWALRNLGELESAAAAATEARELFAAAGDRGGVARALNASATLLSDQGRLEEATAIDLEALEIFRQLEDRRRMGWSLNNLARNLRARGDLSGARRMYEESLAICREIDDVSGTARAEANLGRLLLEGGELAAAQKLHDDSLHLREQIGEARGIAGAGVDLGVVLLARGELAAAAERLDGSARALLEIGDKQSAAHAFDFLGDALLAKGDIAASRSAHERALLLFQELGSASAAQSRLALARVALAEGEPAHAAEELSALLKPAARPALGRSVTMAHALLAVARLELGDVAGAREARRAAGQTLPRQIALADRLDIEILVARVDGLLGGDATQRLAKVVTAARAAGLKEPEIEARLLAAELALARAEHGARDAVREIAQSADTAGFGLVAARARHLLARSEAP